MSPTHDDVLRATDAAHRLEAQGLFARVKTGDERAASYFARLVAAEANPAGRSNDWGCLAKTGGGFNVEGFADGAIVFGADPADRHNVLKIVTQVGSTDPNAIQIGSEVQDRREADVWRNPVPAPAFLRAYLLEGHAPPQPAEIRFPPRDETFAFGVAANTRYQAKGAPQNGTIQLLDGTVLPRHLNFEGEIVWLQQYLLYRVRGESHIAATEKVLAEIDAAWPK